MREWTVDEARAALPRVREIITRVRELARLIATGYTGNGQQRHDGETPAQAEMRRLLGELADGGIMLRDIEQGLVDFPARAPSGREYYLCWLEGEAELNWWHWIEDGFAGRTLLSDPPV